MATSYTAENYSRSVLSSGYSKEIKDMVERAVHLGWTLRIDSKGGAGLHSPNQDKTFHLSTGKTSGPIQRMLRDIVKYGDPKLVAAEAKRSMTEHPPTPEVPSPIPGETCMVEVDADGALCNLTRAEHEHIAHDFSLERVPLTIVESRTMKRATERLWSSGLVDYACNECGITRPTPNAVNSHAKKHVNERLRAQAAQPAPPQPTQAELNALEVIGEIRTLVSQPLLDEIAHLEGQLEVAEAKLDEMSAQRDRVAELEAQVEELTAARERDRERLHTFRELLDGEFQD